MRRQTETTDLIIDYVAACELLGCLLNLPDFAKGWFAADTIEARIADDDAECEADPTLYER